MSSNTNTSRYKQVNRQARIQTREGAFSKGMLFTDKPLTEGYSKLLVNYDIDPLDGTLHTRKGLQATGVYPVSSEGSNPSLFEMDKGFTNIVDSKAHSLGNTFQNEKAKGLATSVVTYNTATNALNVTSLADFVDEERHSRTYSNIIDTKKYPYKAPYAIQPLCDGADDAYQVIPQTVLEPSIHGQACTHDLYFRKPIGAFAFGTSYYAFSRHTVGNNVTDELHQVKYYTDKTKPLEGEAIHSKKLYNKDSVDLYDYQVIPQKLNPSEAATAGYNMLAENPYDFECEDGGNITILGVLPYTGNMPLLKPVINQDFLLKCYYRAPITSGVYQLVQNQQGDYYINEDTFGTAADRWESYSRTFTHSSETGEITLGSNAVTAFNTLQKGTVIYSSSIYGQGEERWPALYKHEVIGDSYIEFKEGVRSLLATRTQYLSKKVESTTEYRVKWEWREVGATIWNTIKEEMVDFTVLQKSPLTCPFSSAVEQAIIRVTITNPEQLVEQVDGTKIEYVESTTAFGLRFSLSNTEGPINAAPKRYNLATAKGMLEWKNRLVLWGVEDAETILFTSDVNNPSYFPYPNNIDTLDEPIIHCMLYGDDLLAFTNTKLYRLTIGETGGIGAHTLIQKNLNISEKDIPMFCLVKNMVFFKSGNYYYMLVPKSSSVVGETTIAPISNTIYPFLDNFSKEVDKLFSVYTQGKTDPDLKQKAPWQYPLSSFLEYYYAYADNENVVLNFVYDYSGFIKGYPEVDDTGAVQATTYREALNNWEPIHLTHEDKVEYCRPKDKRQFILSLIYDTSAYAWSIKVHEAPNVVQPIYHNAVGQQYYMYITVQTDADKRNPVFVQCTKQNTEDNFIVYQKGTFDGLVDYEALKTITKPSDLEFLELQTHKTHTVQKNHQYLDTGYRMLTGAVDIKKRFRELQFSIDNVSQKALTFYTAFLIDGNVRKDMRGYITQTVLDADDPNSGTLMVERPYVDPIITPGDTTLDDTFTLDNTQFPELAYWKVRVAVSGKGFVPRLQILSVNDKEYSILSTNWVYRTMNSR